MQHHMGKLMHLGFIWIWFLAVFEHRGKIIARAHTFSLKPFQTPSNAEHSIFGVIKGAAS